MSAAMVEAVMPKGTMSPKSRQGLPPLSMNMAALMSGGNACLDEQIERLTRCEYLREEEVQALCLKAREILVDESNVQRVNSPVTVSPTGKACFNRIGISCSPCAVSPFLRFVEIFMDSSMT